MFSSIVLVYFVLFFGNNLIDGFTAKSLPKILVEKDLKGNVTEEDELCPIAGNIYPCICIASVDNNYADIDCSLVESEDQLDQIFSVPFPLVNMRSFNIQNNYNLRTLTRNVFGQVTFQYFRINTCLINSIVASVFDNFDYSLISLEVSYTKVTDASFPFSKLQELNHLKSLYLVYDLLNSFPILSSSSLELVDFVGSYFTNVPASAFSQTPLITTVDFESGQIVSLVANAFSGLNFLESIDLRGNEISIVNSFVFDVTSSTKSIDLNSNNITYMKPDAFQGFANGILDLGNNFFTTFSEITFSSILQGNNTVYIDNNPLVCMCDMAWVMTDPTLFDLISSNDPTCEDGTPLKDLDPDFFLQC